MNEPKQRFMLSNASRLRRIIAGVSLILAPFFLLVSNLLQTRGYSDVNNLLQQVGQRPVENELSFAFALYGFVLFIPAVMGLLHLLRKKSAALGHIGGGLLILGMVSFAFIAGTESILFIAGADTTLNKDALIAINNRLGESVVYNIINLTEVFGYLFGTIFLSIALYRAKIVQPLFPLLLAVAIVMRFTFANFYVAAVLSDVLYTIAFTSIGYFVLKMSDKEWESYNDSK